jgi:Fe-S cluster assembly iron-binding protein IscA
MALGRTHVLGASGSASPLGFGAQASGYARTMLVLTDQAVEAIRGIVEDSELGPNGGLRISGANEGNGEAALEFELAPEALEGDEVVRERGAIVFLDETAAAVLAGRTRALHPQGANLHVSIDEPGEEA